MYIGKFIRDESLCLQVDQRLITGQNPASATAVGEEIVKQLAQK